jgi:hypothetical protein
MIREKLISSIFKVVLLIFLNFFIGGISNAQIENSNERNKPSIVISQVRFNELVDSCVNLLETKKLAEISDSGNIFIIMCFNTIFYVTKSKDNFEKRFTGERYQKLESILQNLDYAHWIMKIYPKWIPNKGMGIYLPYFNIDYGGDPGPHSVYKVLEK